MDNKVYLVYIQSGGWLSEVVYGEKALKVSSSHRNSHVMCEAGVNGARAREWADGHERCV